MSSISHLAAAFSVQPQGFGPDLIWLQVLSGLLASKEYVVSHSHGRLMTQRLVPAPVPAPRQLTSKAAGTVLVTGGSKGLGLAYAMHAAAAGSLQSLVIAARSPELPLDTLIALAEKGVPVWTVQYALPCQLSADGLSTLLHVVCDCGGCKQPQQYSVTRPGTVGEALHVQV